MSQLSSRMQWLARPAVLVPLLASLLGIAVLLTPEPSPTGRNGDARLSTTLATPQGAKGLADLAERLGWRVERLDEPFPSTLDSSVIHAVLDTPRPLTPRETHTLLEAVRRGGSLLFVIGTGSALTDSLGVRRGPGLTMVAHSEDVTGCRNNDAEGTIKWGDGQAHLWAVVPTAPLPMDTVAFVHVVGTAGDEASEDSAAVAKRRRFPAALGMHVGAGRVVVVGDPDIFRNDVMRICRWGAGPRAVAMLDWLSARGGGAPLNTVVFDEYHQGVPARRGGMLYAMRTLFTETSAGRALAQALLAALILVAALAPRPLTPLPKVRFERRSSMEHVRALARIYERIGASRLAAHRLVAGLRRRRGAGWRAGPTDREFLASIAERHPSRQGDVTLLLDALDSSLPADRVVALNAAADRIDESLRSPLLASPGPS